MQQAFELTLLVYGPPILLLLVIADAFRESTAPKAFAKIILGGLYTTFMLALAAPSANILYGVYAGCGLVSALLGTADLIGVRLSKKE